MEVAGSPEKASLAQLLQLHGVVVRGGPSEALKLMDALVVSLTLGHTDPHRLHGQSLCQLFAAAEEV